jgi:serine/threonine protein kinase
VRTDKEVFKDPAGPMGTPNYIAPEVLSRNENSKKLDIWAFGVILYTMAFGEHPFDVEGQ